VFVFVSGKVEEEEEDGGGDGDGFKIQAVEGGDRSVGPTYMPGRSNTCSIGVLRLY